jgi:hypothetical protein
MMTREHDAERMRVEVGKEVSDECWNELGNG